MAIKRTASAEAKIPGAKPDQFASIAEAAKTGCPVSKLFNAKITMQATLE